MNKAGRKPKGWKPPYSTSLQVIKKDIILTFDDDDIKGDLKDLMMKVKDSQEDQQED